MANLDHVVSDQTVGNTLRRHGIAPAPKRSQITTWKDFIHSHMDVLVGIDFFTVEVLTWKGLATYYVLFLIHLESRKVSIAGVTGTPPKLGWSRLLAMRQMRYRDVSVSNAMFCMTATQSSAHRSDRY